MTAPALSVTVKRLVSAAARRLGAADPLPWVGGLLDRTFPLPAGSEEYAHNHLTPGAAPLEPSYSEREPGCLRFTVSPLEPDASPAARRGEATREARRLIRAWFDSAALRWFDRRSEEWRGAGRSRLRFGAWLGTAFDAGGLSAVKIYYEMRPPQLDALPRALKTAVLPALEAFPRLRPRFTSIRRGRDAAHQRVTFEHAGALGAADLARLSGLFGIDRRFAHVLQAAAPGDLPDGAVLIGFAKTAEGPELKLEVLLRMLPGLPPDWLDLLRGRHPLRGLSRWLRAFMPQHGDAPGGFSVLSIRATPRSPARLSLYLRPAELEIRQRFAFLLRTEPTRIRLRTPY